MTTATEILQSIADAWAQSLGGKMPVTIRVSVYAGGPCPEKPYFTAEIGPYGHNWHAFEDDLQKAKDEAEHKWHLDGSPIEAKDVEKAKLRAKAAELGLRIMEDTEALIDPVKDL